MHANDGDMATCPPPAGLSLNCSLMIEQADDAKVGFHLGEADVEGANAWHNGIRACCSGQILVCAQFRRSLGWHTQ